MDGSGHRLSYSRTMDGIPMENGIASFQARRSFQSSRNSMALHRRSSSLRQEARLVREYEEQGLGLTRLDEDVRSLASDDLESQVYDRADDEDGESIDSYGVTRENTYINTLKNGGTIMAHGQHGPGNTSDDDPWTKTYDDPAPLSKLGMA